MGLSGPVRTIALSRKVSHVCEDCVHADACALEPAVICTERRASNFTKHLYAWQVACDLYLPSDPHDLTLHVYP